MKTYVVRLAELAPAPDRAPPEPPATLRGVVDEVATGTRIPFRTTEELVALLETGLGSGDW
ncbi:hypothetical protein [Nocardioides dilutus]